MFIGQASSWTVILNDIGLFWASLGCGTQKKVPDGLFEKLFVTLKVALEVDVIPDHDIILLLDDPIWASIVKVIVSPKSAHKFKESSIEDDVVTSGGLPLKPLKTGGTVVHGRIIIWISRITLPIKTPFLYSEIFIATIPISVAVAVIHKFPELGSNVVVPVIGVLIE